MVSVDVKHHAYRTFRAKERSRAGRWSWVLKERWIIICGSRRDQELDPQESPGKIKSREVELGSQREVDNHLRVQARSRAGPSREPRKDKEQGGGAGLSESWTILCFVCSSTIALRTL